MIMLLFNQIVRNFPDFFKRAKSATIFSRLIKLLPMKEYAYPVLSGIVASSGGYVSQSMVCRLAIMDSSCIDVIGVEYGVDSIEINFTE